MPCYTPSSPPGAKFPETLCPVLHAVTKKIDDSEDFMGMGFRRCRDMEPQWQVRHRCPCLDKAVCGDEEDKVKGFSEAGQIGSNYVLP